MTLLGYALIALAAVMLAAFVVLAVCAWRAPVGEEVPGVGFVRRE